MAWSHIAANMWVYFVSCQLILLVLVQNEFVMIACERLHMYMSTRLLNCKYNQFSQFSEVIVGVLYTLWACRLQSLVQISPRNPVKSK